MNILNLLAGNNYFIYNKDIAKNMGTDVAIILGLLCNRYNYYQKENKLIIIDNKEYFYCTRETIYDETALKESIQRRAMKILEDNTILEHKKIGIPSKNYYYINQEKLLETIEKLSSVKNAPLEVENNDNLSLKKCTQILNNNINKENINNEYIVKDEIKHKKDIVLKENSKCIIQYLNESIGSKYRYDSKETLKLINARFKDGYVLDDFYDVIDKKKKEWLNTEMEQYLRPSTLFGNKFENYVNQKSYFSGTPKTSYGSKPNFDNTSNHNIKVSKMNDESFNGLTRYEKIQYLEKLPIADMTEEQRRFFDENCLAKDENGNNLEF